MSRTQPFRYPRSALQLLMLLSLLAAIAQTGCAGTVESLGAVMSYRGAPLAAEQIVRDISYRESADTKNGDKHRLDLFLPTKGGESFPTMIFIHGGGWTDGDRNTGLFSIRPYQNLGRFWARQGIAVAVVSYRLQPAVDWHAQIADVADATAWVRAHIAEYGGRPDALYVSGHSAGAWLAARLAFDPTAQDRARIEPGDLCGAILVSGAAFDVNDPKTYALGSSPKYFAARFDDQRSDWKTRASIVPLAQRMPTGAAPPARIFFAEGEAKTFERQAELLETALDASGQDVKRQRIPGLNHQKIVISMSLAETPLVESIRTFLQEADCQAKPTAHTR
ncbi:MAG: alpha/beta hydrolase [Myxococcota bacterium]